MDDHESLSVTERRLLMAAAVQGLFADTDLTSGTASTFRVVDQALQWQRLSAEEILTGWDKEGTVNAQVYNVLVGLFHRPGAPLFEGYGNWGVPGDPSCPASWAHYNSCRLTARGERIALDLLSQHPEFRG